MRDLIVRFGLLVGLDRLVAWLEPRLQHAVEWLGFTPTQRERALQRAMLRAAEIATEQRTIVGRVEVLLRYRESLGATTIDVESLHEALFGEGGHP
jgi:hypothetical protein